MCGPQTGGRASGCTPPLQKIGLRNLCAYGHEACKLLRKGVMEVCGRERTTEGNTTGEKWFLRDFHQPDHCNCRSMRGLWPSDLKEGNWSTFLGQINAPTHTENLSWACWYWQPPSSRYKKLKLGACKTELNHSTCQWASGQRVDNVS